MKPSKLRSDTIYFLKHFIDCADRQGYNENQLDLSSFKLFQFVKALENEHLQAVWNRIGNKMVNSVESEGQYSLLSIRFCLFLGGDIGLRKSEDLECKLAHLIQDTCMALQITDDYQIHAALFAYACYGREGLEMVADEFLRCFAEPLAFTTNSNLKNNLPSIQIKEAVSVNQIHKWLKSHAVELKEVCRKLGGKPSRQKENLIRDLGFFVLRQQGLKYLTISTMKLTRRSVSFSLDVIKKGVQRIERELNLIK